MMKGRPEVDLHGVAMKLSESEKHEYQNLNFFTQCKNKRTKVNCTFKVNAGPPLTSSNCAFDMPEVLLCGSAQANNSTPLPLCPLWWAPTKTLHLPKPSKPTNQHIPNTSSTFKMSASNTLKCIKCAQADRKTVCTFCDEKLYCSKACETGDL